MMIRAITILSAVTWLCWSSAALAQAPRRGAAAAADPDMKELAAYTLTLDTLNKMDRVNKAMIANIQSDPKYTERVKAGKELAELKKKDDTTEAEDKRIEQLEARIEQLDAANDSGGDAKTLTDMERKIAGMPALAGALKAEGVAPREYAKFMMALVQASFALAGQRLAETHRTAVPMPEGVNPANVKFVQEHAAEIKKMQAAYEQAGIR